MRIIQADTVGHFTSQGKRHCIYSCDFQPAGPRLATGGADCTVKIWNLAALLEFTRSNDHASNSTNENTHSSLLLATLTSHTKSVNTVRWSRDGKYLASGSDDNYISIYVLSTAPNSSSSSFGQRTKNLENWIRSYTLSGHSMDVLDLDWSPITGLLASGSVDNRICLWDIHSSLFESQTSKIISPIQILTRHQSFVKGVAFDPIGKYFISCDSGNLVIIWDCEQQFSVLKVLEDPLRGSPDATMFRRIHWSPDGTSVCLTSATKSRKPIGVILRRNDWENIADLVGHKTSSIATRFCPFLFAPRPSDTSNDSSHTNTTTTPVVSTVVALGDQEGVLSLWSNLNQRALYVFTDLFSEAITDITWFTNSTSSSIVLACCSHSGEMLFVDFQSEELGGAILQEEMLLNQHYQQLYGKTFHELQPLTTSSSSVTTAINNYHLNEVEQEKFMESLLTGELTTGKLNNNGRNSSNGNRQAADVLVHNPLALQYLQQSSRIISNPTTAKNANKTVSDETVNKPRKEKKRVTLRTNLTDTQPLPSTFSSSASAVNPDSTAMELISTPSPDTTDNDKNNSDDPTATITTENNPVEKPKTIISPSPAIAALLAARMNHQQDSVASTTIPQTTASNPTLQQQRVVNVNGKKRIRPALIDDNHNQTESAEVAASNNNGSSERKRLRFPDNNNNHSLSEDLLFTNTNYSNEPMPLPNHTIIIHCPPPSNHSSPSSSSHYLSFQTSLSNYSQQLLQTRQSRTLIIPIKSTTSSNNEEEQYLIQGEILTAPELVTHLPRFQILEMMKITVLVRGSHTHHYRDRGESEIGVLGWLEPINTSIDDTRSEETKKVLWSTLVTGDITSMMGIRLSPPNTTNNNSDNSNSTSNNSNNSSEEEVGFSQSRKQKKTTSIQGLLIIGSQSGSLVIYDLETGLALGPPIILGATIVFIDAIEYPITPTPTPGIRMAVMTVSGQLCIYQADYISNYRGMSMTWKLSLVTKATVEAIYLSLQARYFSSSATPLHSHSNSNKNSNSSNNSSNQSELMLTITSLLLDPGSGQPILSMKATLQNSTPTSNTSNNSRYNVASSSSSSLSDYLIYLYDHNLQQWLQLYHSQYYLSNLFLQSTSSNNNHSNTSNTNNSLSLAKILQKSSFPLPNKLLSIKEILQLSKLKMMSAAATSTMTTPSNNTDSPSSNHILTVAQWSDLMTIAHAEERLNTAILLRNESEIYQTLQDWIRVLCQAKLFHKIEILLLQLLSPSQHHDDEDAPPPPPSTSNGIARNGHHQATSQSNNLYQWIFAHPSLNNGKEFSQEIVDSLILPTIASVANEESQLFLQDILQMKNK